MMEKCIDAGTIQAFLDGELASELQEKVACHIADCDACALSMAEAEEETAFAFSALEQEFNTLVPTNRLWMKINDSIEQNQNKSVWQTVFANFKLLFANRSIAAFASLLIIGGIFAVVWNSNNKSERETIIAENTGSPKQEIDLPKQINPIPASDKGKVDEKPSVVEVKSPATAKEVNNYQVVKTNFVKNDFRKQKNQKPLDSDRNYNKPPKNAETVEYLPGEDSYIKTIAVLEKTVESHKDEVLKPSARFSFEKDLAVANDAISKMKVEVKKNPKNEAAKQVLLSSYQNKIDLLNTVAEKNELMASLK